MKRFYLLYFPHFLSFALNYMSKKDICRDIVQEVFIAYWEKRADFTDIISLKVFFYRSIRNRCLNEIRDSASHLYVEIEKIRETFSENELEENVIRDVLAGDASCIPVLTKAEAEAYGLSLSDYQFWSYYYRNLNTRLEDASYVYCKELIVNYEVPKMLVRKNWNQGVKHIWKDRESGFGMVG